MPTFQCSIRRAILAPGGGGGLVHKYLHKSTLRGLAALCQSRQSPPFTGLNTHLRVDKSHIKPWPGARISTWEGLCFLDYLQVPALSDFQTPPDCCRAWSASVVAGCNISIHTYERKLVLWNNGKQWHTVLRLPVALRTPKNLDTQAPQVGPSLCPFKKSKQRSWTLRQKARAPVVNLQPAAIDFILDYTCTYSSTLGSWWQHTWSEHSKFAGFVQNNFGNWL